MADLLISPDLVNPTEQLPSDKLTRGPSHFTHEKMEAQRLVQGHTEPNKGLFREVLMWRINPEQFGPSIRVPEPERIREMMG